MFLAEPSDRIQIKRSKKSKSLGLKLSSSLFVKRKKVSTMSTKNTDEDESMSPMVNSPDSIPRSQTTVDSDEQY